MNDKNKGICKECNAELTGRTDKKFCSDTCRNIHHNAINKLRDEALKAINRKLKRNALILESLVTGGIKYTKVGLLHSQGFNFEFSTHQLIAPDGKKYKYCYNYGYHIVNSEEIILVTVKDLER